MTDFDLFGDLPEGVIGVGSDKDGNIKPITLDDVTFVERKLDGLQWELYEGWWRPIRPNRPQEDPEILEYSGQRNILVSYTYDPDVPESAYYDSERWFNSAIWPTEEDLQEWINNSGGGLL